MTDLSPIEERTDVDAAIFRDEIVPAARPVVMRGLVSHWPSVRAAQESASALGAVLRSFDAGHVLPFIAGPPSIKGRFFYDEALEGMNFQHRRATLSEVFDAILEMVDLSRPPAIAMQSVREVDALPGFAARHPCPVLAEDIMPRFWLGNAVTVQTHFDLSQNVACVVAGRRHFTLFPPAQTKNLYVGPFERTPAGPLVSMAPLDPPDLQRYPRLAQAMDAAQSAELGPGDAIFIPYMWWHHVRSLDPVGLLANYWWSDEAGPDAPILRPMEGLIAAMVSVRDLSPNAREAWRALFDAFVFEAGQPTADHLPVHRRGVQGQMGEAEAESVRKALAAALHRPSGAK